MFGQDNKKYTLTTQQMLACTREGNRQGQVGEGAQSRRASYAPHYRSRRGGGLLFLFLPSRGRRRRGRGGGR